MSNVYLRASTGSKPYTFELRTLSGALIDSRTSNRMEEKFTMNGYGFRWKITDSKGDFQEDAIDAVTHELSEKEMRMKSIYFYSSAKEAMGVIDQVLQIPGFNTASINFHSYLFFGNATQFNHSRWTQVYDHTQPNQSFSEDQNKNSLDEAIYKAYNTGTNLQNRVQLRIVFSGSLRIDEVSQNWGYSVSDLPIRPNGQLADSSPSNTYEVRFPSYASQRALDFFKECFKKLCYRYQRAINDGTIRDISFQLNESGESNTSGAYYDDQRKYEMSVGDYNPLMLKKFADFCVARFNNVETFNQRLKTSVKSLTAADLNSNTLAYNANGGNKTLQAFWHWFLMEQHDLFEYEIQKYAYDNVALTRSRLFCFDVGSIYNGDMFRMKSFIFRQRLFKNPKRWMTVKSNNSNEGSDTPEYVCDQIITAARLVGAYPCWEPSPAFQYFTVDFLSEAVNACLKYGVGLSAFSASEDAKMNPPRPDSVTFWKQVSAKTNLANYTTTFKPDDLDSSGNTIIASLPYLSTALNGIDDHTGDYFVFQAWKKAHDANPGKRICILVDDEDVRMLFVNPYPLF